ncbi:AraC family transcriptional regulator [Dysosmobacter sp. Phy]
MQNKFLHSSCKIPVPGKPAFIIYRKRVVAMDEKTIAEYETSAIKYVHLLSTSGAHQIFEMDNHDFNEFYILLQGNIVYELNGYQYMLQPGDILSINKHSLHRPIVLPSVCYERIYIHISPDYICPYMVSFSSLFSLFKSDSRPASHLIRLDSSQQSIHASVLLELESAIHAKNGSTIDKLIMHLMFIYSLSYLDGTSGLQKGEKIDGRLLPIIDYIENHYTDHIKLDDLSKEFFISKYHLCHTFKETMGFTLINYVNFKRVRKAMDLIKSQVPIVEVCYSVGFSNYSNFYNIFKKFVGIGPNEYAKSL